MRIFSGIQPTGRKHLGNYIGAIIQYVAGQDRADPSIYCIVNQHAVTVPYDPADLRERTLDTAAIRRSTASSTCTLRASPTTRRRCPATCWTRPRC